MVEKKKRSGHEAASRSKPTASGNERSKSRDNDYRKTAEPISDVKRDKSIDKLNKDRSNEELSMSSQSKAQMTQKR